MTNPPTPTVDATALAERLRKRANEYNDREGLYSYIGDDVALDDQAASLIERLSARSVGGDVVELREALERTKQHRDRCPPTYKTMFINVRDVDTILAALSRTEGHGSSAQDADKCPICAESFRVDDICAIDVQMGTCHAECLEGSPIVDLDTEEPSDGALYTFRYGSEETIPAKSSSSSDGGV